MPEENWMSIRASNSFWKNRAIIVICLFLEINNKYGKLHNIFRKLVKQNQEKETEILREKESPFCKITPTKYLKNC
jgi:hypothetical protein